MTTDQNKIAQSLSAEQLQEFLDRCWKTPGLTLAKVQELAGGYGIAVSLMGAKSFRDTTFARHLQRIEVAGRLSKQLEELGQSGAGNRLGAAAEALIGQRVIDKLVEFEATEQIAEDGGIEALDALSKITKRLSDSERGNTALEARIREYERRETERQEKKRALAEELAAASKTGEGLSPEAIADIEQKIRLL